jgi:hypothetical protein
MSKTVEREDFLEEDAEIAGQKYCLLSFLSPEKVLEDKNLFMFEKFLQVYEFQSRTKGMEEYLMKTISEINSKLDAEADSLLAQDLSGASEICRKSKIRLDKTIDSLHEFIQGNQKELRDSKLKEAYDEFIYANRTKMEDEFYVKNEFRTTVRGLKIRGTYASQEEAVARSKKLQRQDTLHNIFVGEVGKWLPWDPQPSDVKEQEYAEDQLNTLMKKYKENEEHRESFQRERRTAANTRSKATAPRMEVVGNDTSIVGAPVGEVDQFSSMFGASGPADLAMARKMDMSGASM